jgi:nicotinate phosphoribosyltransferase
MFTPEFMEWFEALRLPPYHLERDGDQYELTFEGKWPEVMLWEIPALAVLMELRGRAVLQRHGPVRAAGALRPRHDQAVGKDRTRLRESPTCASPISAPGGGHSFLWQDWCVQAMQEGLGDKFVGTSNCLIAKNRDLEAIGTNAHELPMVYAALAETTPSWPARPMTCCRLARRAFRQPAHHPARHLRHRRVPGPRPTGWPAGPASASIQRRPGQGRRDRHRWWKSRGEDPREKLVIFSDGLDVDKIESCTPSSPAACRCPSAGARC